MAGNKLYMAVDLGTSFIKAGVYDAQSRCIAECSEPVPDERPAPGMFIQRGDDLFEAVCRCIRSAARALGDDARCVEAMAFTGQMAGSMGVDEHWNDVTGWSCTLDSRYLPWAERQRAEVGTELFEIGCTNAPVMCSKYAWFRDSFPEDHKRIAKYVMLNGFVIGRLSGIPVHEAKIDYSLITWTGLADTRRREWSRSLCQGMGVDVGLLPEIVSCTTVGGTLGEAQARSIGLRAGIPLVVGAGDKVSGCVGAGILRQGDMIFEASSYGAISRVVPEVWLDTARRNYDVIGSVDDSSFLAHKYIQGSGISIDWFVDTFIKGADADTSKAFAEAERLAAQVPPGSDRMLSIGLLGGSAMPFDSEIRGLFMGHTWGHGMGHFYRSLLEGFSYDLALTLDSLRAAYGAQPDATIKLIGGGAHSTVWPQMLSDVTGMRFATLDRKDVALWGTALLAAAGTGSVDDLAETALAHAHTQRVYEPDGDMTRRYAPYVAFYEECAQRLHPLYEKLNRME
ncbi:MAG: hypothetical protein IJJ45_01605 [Clostridia bacterium]|nr:hypothetical protein [Clostridia bacterium]